MFTKEEVLKALEGVQEPDLKKDIVTLNLVENIRIEENKVSFVVKVSNPALHARKRMQEACEMAIHRFLNKELEVDVNVVGLPQDRDPELRKILPGVKNIIAVASGKGGVGKSTITSNLAAGLAKKGYKVGLIDADIHGPSMPIMFDVESLKPRLIDVDGEQLIEPIESYGVKMLSIGFFADTSQAIVWRGPMAAKALGQLFTDAHWGELDFMIIDLPPGTGDVHLQLVQTVPVSGVVIVSTPQAIALADASKGVSMFQLPNINVPVLGIVENMAYFTPAELPDNKYYIFGKEGGVRLAESLDVKLLGQIPLVQSICEAGDVGRPAILAEGTPQAVAMENMVENVIMQLEIRNQTKQPTEKLKIT